MRAESFSLREIDMSGIVENPGRSGTSKNEDTDFCDNEKLSRRCDFRNKKKMEIKDAMKVQPPKKMKGKKRKVKFFPQSSESHNLFSDLVDKLKSLDKDAAVKFVETCLTVYLFKVRKSTLDRCLITLAYVIKMHCGGDYSNLFLRIMGKHEFNFIGRIREWTIEEIKQFCVELLQNWTVASKNEAFGAIMALLSTVIAIFYGADKKLSCTVGSFSLFVLDARNSCKGAVSVIDAVLKVCTYVITGFQEYVNSGTMSGFLYADDQLAAFDTTVSDIRAKFSMVQPGNLDRCSDIDENTFDNQLQKAIVDGERLVRMYDGTTKKYVLDRLRILRQVHVDFIQYRVTGGLRMAPFAYALSGSTGLGKSSVNEILMRYILSINGYNHEDAYICTINSQDKYFSTYRSYVNGVIFDDFANVVAEKCEESPCDVLLKFVNNIPFYLNMAELELKGKVVAEPKVVGVTTNVATLDADKYSNQPSSILRRMKVHIYASVRPEYRKEGTVEIDPDKVHAKFGVDCLAPDIWLFNVYTVKVEALNRAPKMDYQESYTHKDDHWKLEPIKYNGVEMTGITIAELLLYLKFASRKHFEQQVALVERSKKFNDVVVCERCEAFVGSCNCDITHYDNELSDILEMENVLRGEIDEIVPHSALDVEYYSFPKISPYLPSPLFIGELHLCSNPLYVPRQCDRFEPHAAVDSSFMVDVIRKRTFDVKHKHVRSMLLTWITDGRGAFDHWFEEFSSKLSDELQYFLEVFKLIVLKYLRKWKSIVVELCIPLELEQTLVGDYLSLVLRSEQVSSVAHCHKGLEYFMWFALMWTSISLFENKSKLRFISLVLSMGFLLFAKPAMLVATTCMMCSRLKAYFSECTAKLREWVHCHNPWWITPIVTYGPYTVGKFLNKFGITNKLIGVVPIQCVPYVENLCSIGGAIFLSLFIMRLRKYSIDNYEAPRAVSTLYKFHKSNLDLQYMQIVPAALTVTGIACNWEQVVDFYGQALTAWYMQPHSALNPSPGEVMDRDKKKRFDEEWFKVQAVHELDELPTSVIRTASETRNALEANLWSVKNLYTSVYSNALVVRSGFVLIPAHTKPEKRCKFRFVKHERGNMGNQAFEAFIEPSQCIELGTLDLIMVWLPKTGDVRDLVSLFPTKFVPLTVPRTGRIATRSLQGKLTWGDVSDIVCVPSTQNGTGCTFPGALYFWENAEVGTCISPIVSDGVVTSITGLHIGGSKTRSSKGFACTAVSPTQNDILAAIRVLESFPTVIPMSSAGDFHVNVMGEKVLDRCIKKKSCFIRMDVPNNVRFVGSSKNCNRNVRSSVRSTMIEDDVRKIFDISMKWGPPKLQGPDGHSKHIPWESGMQKWIIDKPGVSFELLNDAKVDYFNTLKDKLHENRMFWIQDLKVLTWDQAVNGIPGKRFIDAINFTSSIGFPFRGPKKNFSVDKGRHREWQNYRLLDPEFIEEAKKIENLLLERKRYYPWYTSTLKDEPTDVTKEKVRVFQASSTPFQLVVRKYTLPICRFLQMNPLISESAVGIDPTSIEWHEMVMHLKDMQTPLYDRWFAVDYKAYDTSISSQLILAVGSIFCDLAKEIGYLDSDIIILQSIFTELAFSVVDFNGDVLILDGANPSGNPLTVFINGLVNSLLMRMCFYSLYPSYKFSKHVRLMDYGDDLIGSIRSTVPKFNMQSFAEFVLEFGFTVTSADKTTALQKYVSIEKVDFLKRKIVWSKDLQKYIAPLDEFSIYKRLCSYMSSKTSPELIVGANIDGALDEWFFYGRKKYDENQVKLIGLVEKYMLHRFVYRINLTYEERVLIWKEKCAVPTNSDKCQSMDTEKLDDDNSFLGFFGWGNRFPAVGNGGPPISFNLEDDSSTSSDGILRTTNQINIKNESEGTSAKRESTHNQDVVAPYLEWGDFVPHSTQRHQLMGIDDGEADQIVNISSAMDETRMSRDTTNNSLGEFLARPVQIYTGDWSPSITYNLTLEPWRLFVIQKRVSNRMNNFKLFRGKLKVKIMINGNSFYYGRLMASYVPFYVNLDDMTSMALAVNDSVQLSQCPRLFIDPTTSTGGTMTLPFFYHKDYISALDSAKFAQLGSLHIRQLTALKHTSGDNTLATKVSINVFAWMEDAELDAPTQTNLGYLLPQSGKAVDEREDEMGPISKVATAIENMAIEGSSVPALAPFCTPAQIGARMVRAGAGTFGWSSPSQIEEVKPFVPRGLGNTAVSNSPDTCLKMSFDLKQELSCDPRIMGLDSTDEMQISYIAKKESWIDSFDWTTAANPKDLLYNIRVDPCHWAVTTTGTTDALHFAASCGATIPFRYWTGAFKIRLQIVSSAFHRGRLMIVYDPVRTATLYEENIANCQIVDIATNRDVVFTVPPSQETTLMEHAIPGVTPVSLMRNTSALTEQNFGNGTIAIYVMNELTIPNSTGAVNNDIKVNVFVSMDDDFEVFIPDKAFSTYVIKPQSGIDCSSLEILDNFEMCPHSTTVDPVSVSTNIGGTEKEMVIGSEKSSKLNLVYSGEKVSSFRNIIKRYYPYGAITTPNISNSVNFQVYSHVHYHFPLYRGAVPGAVHSATYNYFNVTMLNYLTPAFSARRGSVRWKVLPKIKFSSGQGRSTSYASFSHDAVYLNVGNSLTPSGAGTNNSTNLARANYSLYHGIYATRDRNQGTIAYSSIINPNLEYEIPFYSKFRFVPGKIIDFNNLIYRDNVDGIGAVLHIDQDNNDQSRIYEFFVSAGEDFSLHYFTGWPRLYYEPIASIPLPP